MGIPAAGRSFVETGITILRFSGGKAVEVWQNEDVLDLLYQLGCTMAPPEIDTA
jgi:hypothetical protein